MDQFIPILHCMRFYWHYISTSALCGNSVLYEDQKFFKSDTFESDTIFVTFKSITFEFFGNCSESVNFDANNHFQED